jgi:hypothetical protein
MEYKNGETARKLYGRLCLLGDGKRAFRMNWKEAGGTSGVDSIDFWISPALDPQMHVTTDDLNVVQLVDLIEQVLHKKKAGEYIVNGIEKTAEEVVAEDININNFANIYDWMEARKTKKEKEVELDKEEKKPKKGTRVKRTKIVEEEPEKKAKKPQAKKVPAEKTVKVTKTTKKDSSVNTKAKSKFDALFDDELSEDEVFELLEVSVNMIKGGNKYSLIVSGGPGLGKCIHADTYIPIKFNDFNMFEDTDNPIKKIKNAFDIVSQLEEHEFKMNEEYVPQTPFQVRDEFGKWKIAISMIIKIDEIYSLQAADRYGNIISLKAGSKHKLLNPEMKVVTVANLKPGDKVKIVNGNAEIIECYNTGKTENVYDISIESESHLYQDAEGLIHHNTYGITQQLKGSNYEFFTGSITGPSALYEILFKNNKKDKILVFDDLDSLLGNEDCTNILKGALDSKETRTVDYISKTTVPFEIYERVMRLKKPEDVFEEFPNSFMEKYKTEKRLGPIKVLKMNLELLGDSQSGSAPVDADADTKQARHEAKQQAKSESKITNKVNKLFQGLIEKIGYPNKFQFHSRIIFITNKYLSELPGAIISRSSTVEINLDFAQMVKRIKRIMPKLDYKGVTDEHKKKAMLFLEDIVTPSGKIPRIDFRGFELICELAKTDSPEKVWHKWAAVTLKKAYADISAEEKKSRKKNR